MIGRLKGSFTGSAQGIQLKVKGSKCIIMKTAKYICKDVACRTIHVNRKTGKIAKQLSHAKFSSLSQYLSQ